MTPEKVIRDGKVAVLVSPGFGAGWSTWSDDAVRDFLLFDRRLVELAESGAREDDVENLLTEVLESVPYTGGWRDIRVEWLPVGTCFYVDEYDGSESLRTLADLAIVA